MPATAVATRRAVIYARISKDDRGDRLGVDRQEHLCRELAERHGLEVADVLVDNDVSAYRSKRRPAFERLVEMLEARAVDAVLVYHADRLYRRATDLERLVAIVDRSGTQVHTVAAGDVDLSTASGRMVARMLGAAAQHESERLGERLKVKNDELANRGKHPGGRPPYGYSRGYIVNNAEAAVVRRIAARVLEGASLLAIARELNAVDKDGEPIVGAAPVPTREGRPWHHSTVRAVLINPAIVGLRVHRRNRRTTDLDDWIAGPGEWEPILDRPTWDAVRAQLADPARKRKRAAWRYLLSGLVETCERDPMVGRPDRNAAGRMERRTYATRSPAVLSLAIGADDLEAVIVELVLRRLDNAELPDPNARPDTDPDGDVSALETELAQLAELRGNGTISLAEWLAARDPLQRRLDEARARVGGRRTPDRLRTLSAPGAARAAWPSLDFETKRQLVAMYVEKIVVGPATRARWTTIEERLDPANGGDVVWRY